jgi:glutamate synthase domain-containing protein 1
MLNNEFSSCAVGGIFSKSLDGKKKNIDIVLEFLEKLPHRGGQIFVKHEDRAIKVGDVATKSGFIEAPELIVQAQKTGKLTAETFLKKAEDEYKDKHPHLRVTSSSVRPYLSSHLLGDVWRLQESYRE